MSGAVRRACVGRARSDGRSRSVGLIGAVGLAILVLGGGPAQSETRTALGSGSGVSGVSLSSITATNAGRGVSVAARLPGLERRHVREEAVSLVVSLDSGYADLCGPDGCSRQLRFVIQSAPYFGPTRLERFGSRYEQVACRDLSAKWDYAAETVEVFVPRTCLGRDHGMTRVTALLTREGGEYGRASTGVLQRGKAGAVAGDVDGDGAVDHISQRLVRPGRYEVRVTTADGILAATGPRDADAPWADAPVFSALDIDRDGRAEIIADPADGLGDGSRMHVFRVVDGALTLVRGPGRRPFDLYYAGAGMDVYRDYVCDGAGVSTWRLLRARGKEAERIYRLKVVPHRLADGRVEAGRAKTITVRADTARHGNLSAGSCLTS